MPPGSWPQPLKCLDLPTLPLDCPAQLVVIALFEQVSQYLQGGACAGIKRRLSKDEVASVEAGLSQDALVHRPEAVQRERGHVGFLPGSGGR